MSTQTYDFRTEIGEVLAEKTTRRFTFTVRDADGAAVPAASMSSLTLDLYNRDPARTVIAAARNILNANGGTVDSSGAGVLELSAADNAIVRPGVREETHVALLSWSYSGGSKLGKGEIVFRVANLDKVS